MKNKTKVFTYENIHDTITAIPNLRDKAFFCTVYGCLARVGEVVWGRNQSKKDPTNPPLMKNDIEVKADRITISLLTEKVRLMRKVTVSRTMEGIGVTPKTDPDWLAAPIVEYIDNLKDEDYLFPFTVGWSENKYRRVFLKTYFNQIFEGYAKEQPGLSRDYALLKEQAPKVYENISHELRLFRPNNTHILRKARATHLLTGKVTGIPLPRQKVRRMGGWTTFSELDKVYDLSVNEDDDYLITGEKQGIIDEAVA